MDHFKEERPWPRDITFLLAIVTLLLSVSQCVTLAKFTAPPPKSKLYTLLPLPRGSADAGSIARHGYRLAS